MATVVKANYASGQNKPVLKGNLRYYQTRPDASGARQQRPGFDAERDDLERKDVYKTVEDANETYVYRVILSPGEQLEADELRAWTREVIAGLESERGEKLTWAAYVHDDPEHSHAHALLFTNKKLDRDDLRYMREAGDKTLQQWAAVRQQLAHDPLEGELEESRRVKWSY